MNETLGFLETVLPPEGDHWYVAAIFRNGKCTHLFHRSRLALASCLLEESANGFDVYHACAVFRERAGGRKASNAAGCGSLFSDVDAGPGKQYATATDAHNALVKFAAAEGLPRPLCACSGFGVHAYWPVQALLDPETWKKYAAGLAALLRKHGIKHERTTDLASILRPVGTFNRKRAVPAPVTIMDQPGQIPYQLSQLERLLDAGAIPSRPAIQTVNGHSVAAKLAVISSGGVRYSSPVLSGCGQFGSSALDARGYVPEPLWHLCLGVFAFIEGDGDQTAHEWSSDDDRYDAGQTQSRLDRIRAVTSGATTCTRFHQENPQTCEACPHFQKIKSPIALCTRSRISEGQVQGQNLSQAANTIVLPQLPEPFEWSNQQSLCLGHEDKNGNHVATVISKHAIHLDCVYRREGRDNLFAYGFRQHIPSSGWHSIVIAASTMRSSGGLGELSDQGANIADYSGFLKYTTAAVDMFHDSTQELGTLYEQFGWKEHDESFLYADNLYTATGLKSVVVDKTITTRIGGKETYVGPCRGGSLAGWTAIANKLFGAGLEAQSVCICASFGAVLQRFLSRDEGGSLISLVTQMGGRGKSTALAGALSVWGRKQGLTLENIDSQISRGAALAAVGNIPVFYDEFETCDPSLVREFVRLFTNGRDKRRLNRDGTLRDPGMQWQTTLFTASNASLRDSIASIGNNVLTTRIWEMSTDAPDHLREMFAGDRLKDSLRDQSGWAGAAFLAKLVQPGNVVAARHEVHRWHEQIRTSAKFTNEHRFWVRLAATVAVAGEIVTGGEKILSFDPKRITEWLVRQMIERVENEVVVTEWSFEVIGQFINSCQPHQVVVDGPFYPGQVGATTHVKPTRELYIRKERQGGKIYISRTALTQWCVKHGINTRELIEQLFAAGVCIEQNKNVTLGAGTDYASTQVKCFLIDGRHTKLGGVWGESADVLPFRRPVDPNNDDSLGGVSDDYPL